MAKLVNIVLFSICLDMIGVGLIIPCLSSLTLSLGATAAQYGIISSFYGIGQLIGSPICGSLSDRIGRKWVLLISFGGAAIFYSLMGVAWSLWVVVISRIGVGLVKQTQTVGSVYIAEVVPVKQRTHAMAMLSTATGVGFIIGPICGSLLSRIDVRLPFLLSGFLFLCDTIFGYFYLPVGNINPHLREEVAEIQPCPATGETEGDCAGKDAAVAEAAAEEAVGGAASVSAASVSAKPTAKDPRDAGIELCPAMAGQSAVSMDTWISSMLDVWYTLRSMRSQRAVYRLLMVRSTLMLPFCAWKVPCWCSYK